MKIEFKNGSVIESIEPKGEIIRSKRYEEQLKNHIAYLRKHPSEYIYYATGKRLSLWQRIWIDVVYPMFKGSK